MTAAEARLHLRYSGWASKRLMEAVAKLDPRDLTRTQGVSHGSLLGTLSHIYLADRIWYMRAVDPALEPRAEVDRQTLQADWPELQRKWEAWADGLRDPDLDRLIDYQSMAGDPFSDPVWKIVMHVVNHATLHRGQVMAMLRQMGIAPPGTDLIYYYRELPPGRPPGA